MELCLISLSSGGDGQPTLPELLRLKVPQGVGAHYTTFGVLLLNDELGSRVDCIEEECRGKTERICRKILVEWLEGKGLPVTWKTLIHTLRDTGLPSLADLVQATHGTMITIQMQGIFIVFNPQYA